MHNLGNLLIDSGFSDSILDVENFSVTYNEVGKLFMDIKSIGATNGNVSKNRGLSGKSFTKKIIEKYEGYRINDLLPASYEVIYGHAWNTKKSNFEHLIKYK